LADTEAFSDLVRRLRAGDPLAAEQLVRQYEAVIRLEIRSRIGDRRLRRAFDSMDVCQAVLGSFFVRAAVGQFDLERPENLLHLLKGMAQKKLLQQVRKERAARRDVRRVEQPPDENWTPAGADPTPSRFAANRDLLEAVRARLSPEELQLAERRAQGMEWGPIAVEMGGTPEGRRKQLGRAMDRVAKELGLEDFER
jgi:DNA-directed RNA polymerase specialized sigma24 family protein